MSIFKCKMCGGDLEVTEGINIIECAYCATKQTVPNADSEKKINLFNRANRLRIGGEFDKAASIYESIVAEFPEEAEAYWGLCLCNYGIEYVDDPATANKIPTCHRASFESLQKDENFNLALEYADVVAQKVYRDEAREIDRIMGEILAVSQNEKPYDVFICYKETDEKGERTADSVLAQEIYDALTAKGLKVFFSRITLEDKLGQQYEPYIFAALNSAKVMLSVGTKYEYYHAVWVKNEWSRFLKLMAKDKSKVLIPCYRGIDAYDMPEEFKALQAQDMGKLGAIQDLLRGIEKILPREAQKAEVTKTETVVIQQSTSNPTVDSLLKRAFMFLEDGDWKNADEYCEKVLDIDPECAEAYLGKLMADLQVRKQDYLKEQAEPFDKNSNYQKAVRFANDELRNCLEKYISITNERIKHKLEQERIAVEQKTSAFELAKCEYQKNIAITKIIANGNYLTAVKTDGTVMKAGYYGVFDSFGMVAFSAGPFHSVGLKSDGTVVATGDNDNGQCDVGAWSDIVAISAGSFHTVGLKSDGTVVATGDNYGGRCDVEAWSDIVAISAGGYCTVGLKSDGRVVSTEENDDLNSWSEIVAISAGDDYTVGLKSDGRVMATGWKYDGQCNVGAWSDIVAISAGDYHTVGLKSNGRAVATGRNDDGQCNVGAWSDIVAVSAGDYYTVGLKSDGTVVVTGRSDDRSNIESWTNIVNIFACGHFTIGFRADGTFVLGSDNQYTIDSWSDIVAISAGYDHTVGLKSDGTVVATGDDDDGQCDVEAWSDIVDVSAGYKHTVGLKSNGRVVATGNNDFFKCCVGSWTNIIDIATGYNQTIGLKSNGSVIIEGEIRDYHMQNIKLWSNIVAISSGGSYLAGLKRDGTVVVESLERGSVNYSDVKSWSDIIAISAGTGYIVGLKSDGTVVATGDNDDGQCDVEAWTDIVAIFAGRDNTVGLKSDGTVVSTLYTDNWHVVNTWKLFDNLETYEQEKSEARAARLKRIAHEEQIAREKQAQIAREEQEKEQARQKLRLAGVCQHCGGTFKGLFTKK